MTHDPTRPDGLLWLATTVLRESRPAQVREEPSGSAGSAGPQQAGGRRTRSTTAPYTRWALKGPPQGHPLSLTAEGDKHRHVTELCRRAALQATSTILFHPKSDL